VAAQVLFGCAAATIEQGVQLSPSESALAPATSPIDTGEFPNLNIPRRAETEQLTSAERASKAAELAAARKQTQGQDRGAGKADLAQLRQLGSVHANDALKEIESE
jgi:hypothetical protein